MRSSQNSPPDVQPPESSEAVAVRLRPLRVLLLTGLSGAGKSSALKTLEDLGYEATDNCPISLVEPLLEIGLKHAPARSAVAISIDARTLDFAAEAFLQLLEPLRARADVDVQLLFLDCDDEALRRRYTETRRRHPLAEHRPLPEGIAAERRLMMPLADAADRVLDTTYLGAADLRRLIGGSLRLAESEPLTVSVVSFSYRRGLPREADLVFDVRFLTNPFYEPELRALTGVDPAVAEFIRADPSAEAFLQQLDGMLLRLLPLYEREGKSYLTVGIGCTGGQHRSVFVAEHVAARLTQGGYHVHLAHRELGPRPES